MEQRGVSLKGELGETDVQDAFGEGDDACFSMFDGYSCTRQAGHTGPHLAALSKDTITAIWEDHA